MPTLNFPTNPSLNQTYSFAGKTWFWNGYGWQLQDAGAINGIVIGNVTPAAGTFTTLSATGNISGQYFIGNGSQLTGIATASTIANGTSNISIASANGNVSVNVNGTSNVAVFTQSGISATGNIAGQYFIGNGSQLTGIVTEAGAAIVYGNSNVSIGGPNANVTVGVDGTPNVAVFTTQGISVSGNITAGNISGNGAALTSVMSDRGTDSNNWNTLTQMGVYTVNRASWSGTVGTPLDSQVYVGLLQVMNSTGTAITQVFLPGTVDANNVKIQWNRSYWSGTWTDWIKIVNDSQVVIGGDF